MEMARVCLTLLKHYNKVRVWVVAPTFDLVREDWIVSLDYFKDLITNKNIAEHRLELLKALTIEYKSAEREDEGLRAAGIDFALLDECARIPQRAWEAGIRPALSDKQGKAVFISTPKARNWFFDLFIRGQSNNPEWQSWKFSSKDNPYFPAQEFEQARKELPERIFKQEFEAEFLEDEARVFSGVNRCIGGELQEPKGGFEYTLGVDLAKTEDFTVLTCFSKYDKRVVAFERFNEISWSLQKQKISFLAKKYNNAEIVIDATGVGDPIYEDLLREGLRIIPYKFTNENKSRLIEKLILAIEQRLIGFPEIGPLKQELESFTYEVSKFGNIKYCAPVGQYDDCVISLGLAIWPVDLYTKYIPQREDSYYPQTQLSGSFMGV